MDFISRLHDALSGERRFDAVVGFDGFLDESVRLADAGGGTAPSLGVVGPTRPASAGAAAERRSVRTISAFADLVAQAAGRSMCREIIPTGCDVGGCAVNLGDGLAALGAQVDCFATLGVSRHAAFTDVLGRFRSVHSWGEVGRTTAIEFDDGKILLPCVRAFDALTADVVAREIAAGAFPAACARARVIALTDWSLFPHMTAIWRLVHGAVLRRLDQRPLILVDLVDPAGRDRDDLREAMDVLREMGDSGTVCLSANLNECNQLAALAGLAPAPMDPAAVMALAAAVRGTYGLDAVVVHAHRFAVQADRHGVCQAEAPYTPTPKRSTGAGDRFNAGYCFGWMLGLAPPDRLRLATATAGLFVRSGRSADLASLLDFISAWEDGRITP